MAANTLAAQSQPVLEEHTFSADLSVNLNLWQNPAMMPNGPAVTWLEEDCSILMPNLAPFMQDWIVRLGGQLGDTMHGGAISNQVWLLDTKNQQPQWLTFPSMNMRAARKFANAVLLPDGGVLVVGGGQHPGHGVGGLGVLWQELFRGGTWHDCATQSTERTYHSSALLLPDGRVLSCGGDTCAEHREYEIYTPDYLLNGPGPQWTSPPADGSIKGRRFGVCDSSTGWSCMKIAC